VKLHVDLEVSKIRQSELGLFTGFHAQLTYNEVFGCSRVRGPSSYITLRHNVATTIQPISPSTLNKQPITRIAVSNLPSFTTIENTLRLDSNFGTFLIRDIRLMIYDYMEDPLLLLNYEAYTLASQLTKKFGKWPTFARKICPYGRIRVPAQDWHWHLHPTSSPYCNMATNAVS
jgi:hypothetical protein